MAQSGGPILTDEGGDDTSLLRVQRQQRFFACMIVRKHWQLIRVQMMNR